MAILIDPPLWPAHGTLWSHLISDISYGELHAFAVQLDVPRRGFDLDHYDVPASLYDRAVALGAQPVTSKEAIQRLRRSGLRVRKADRLITRPIRRREFLIDHWATVGDSLITGGGSDVQWQTLGDGLIARWNEPHRSYHDERHLEDVLLSLDQLAQRGEPVPPVTLLAAWFHDAVYQGSPADEAESAQLAAQELGRIGLGDSLVRQVHELIRMTSPSHQAVNPSPPLASLLDADLWIFASSPTRYSEYTASVRREYAHVPLPDFIAGRTTILRRYLDRPRLYFSHTAQTLWEDRARANVAAEIKQLIRSSTDS